MNKDIDKDQIIQLSTLIVSIIAVLLTIIIPLIPYLKRVMINKIDRKILEVYEIYKELNPSISVLKINLSSNLSRSEIYDEAIDRINYEFRKQSLTYFLIPNKNKHKISRNEIINLLDFYDVDLYKRLSISEISKLLKYWKLMLSKIKTINKVINKYHYLTEEKNTGYQWYSKIHDVGVIKSSISFCPSFDKTKLFSYNSKTYYGWKEEKKELNVNKNKKQEKKFFKELKSNEFSINVILKERENKLTNYAYSIYFKDGKPDKLEAFYNSGRETSLSNEEEKYVNDHLKWINTIFGTQFAFKFFDIDKHFAKLEQ